MIFNSLAYLIFFPLVVLGAWCVPLRLRWMLLLSASLYFYMSWKPVYVLLLVATILVDYGAARFIAAARRPWQKRLGLAFSLTTNLGLLGTYKYADFLGRSLNEVLGWSGSGVHVPALNLLLPIGISFYVFQSLSYTIDVYRGSIAPEKHLGYFALYVTFFPQLVAGPIERPSNLLPQLRTRRPPDCDEVTAGLKQIAWGMFKKVVIADRIGAYVDAVYGHPGVYQGQVVILATVFFAFQIFCDFSGYSDIAIGSARILGVRLMTNFNRPYHSLSVSEFWRRWHISLSTWFRDYVYIPLGGNRTSRGRHLGNLWVTFLLSGLWHGANWTFVAWGALHGALVVVDQLTRVWREKISSAFGLARLPRLRQAVAMAATFALVCLGWVLFRARSIREAGVLFRSMLEFDFARPGLAIDGFGRTDLLIAFVMLLVMEIVHVCQAHRDAYARFMRLPVVVRWGAYHALVMTVLLFGVFKHQEFIYFRF